MSDNAHRAPAYNCSTESDALREVKRGRRSFVVGDGLSLAPVAKCVFLVATVAHAQVAFQLPPLSSDLPLPRIIDHYPAAPSFPPLFTIPLGTLGFSVPGESYLLRGQSVVSLDFLDEGRILFTFRAPGILKHRSDDLAADEEQQIQAMVLSLPSGKVEARATWTVPDRRRYLWMLNDGRFLLRQADGLVQGDASLKTTSFRRVPGRLLWIELDPDQKVMITNTLEPANTPEKVGATAPIAPLHAATTDAQKPDTQRVLVARTIRLASGDVLLRNEVPWANQTSDWPMNSQGYVDKSSNNGAWQLMLNSFSGGSRVLAAANSTCPPDYSFVSERELIVRTCDPQSGWKLRAFSIDGFPIWEQRIALNEMMPVLVRSPSGEVFGRETLLLKRAGDRYKRLVGVSDLQGQIVKVFDAAKGNVLFESPLTPIFDGGGNVAFSPSGHRIAILDAGSIQVFDVPVASPTAGAPHKPDSRP